MLANVVKKTNEHRKHNYPARGCAKGLNNWFCPSVSLSVCQFVSLSVCQFVSPVENFQIST